MKTRAYKKRRQTRMKRSRRFKKIKGGVLDDKEQGIIDPIISNFVTSTINNVEKENFVDEVVKNSKIKDLIDLLMKSTIQKKFDYLNYFNNSLYTQLQNNEKMTIENKNKLLLHYGNITHAIINKLKETLMNKGLESTPTPTPTGESDSEKSNTGESNTGESNTGESNTGESKTEKSDSVKSKTDEPTTDTSSSS